MNQPLRWAIRFALFLSALFVLGTGAASAQESGTIDVGLPVDVCGVGVGLLGDSDVDCATAPSPAATTDTPDPTQPGAEPPAGPLDDPTAGFVPLVGDVDVDVDVPIQVCGIGIGATSADCSSTAPTTTPDPADRSDVPAPADGPEVPTTPAPTSSVVPVLPALLDDVDVDVSAPVGLCGVGIGLLGDTGSDCSVEVAGASEQSPPPAAIPELPSPSTPAEATPAALPLSAVDDVVRGALQSAVEVPRTVPLASFGSWLASTGSRSDLKALAGVGLSFLLTGLAARKRHIQIG